MKTSHISLAALIALFGCNMFRRDLIGAGVYRLETVGVVGCEVAAEAVEKDGKLHFDGFIRGARLTTQAEGELEIRLRMPDGREHGGGPGRDPTRRAPADRSLAPQVRSGD